MAAKEKASPYTPSHMAQGFLKHRRREAGTLAQQVGMWRLNQMGRSLLAANLDMANAFASTNWASLDKAAAVLFEEEDVHFARQRFTWSTEGIPACAGELLLRNGQ